MLLYLSSLGPELSHGHVVVNQLLSRLLADLGLELALSVRNVVPVTSTN